MFVGTFEFEEGGRLYRCCVQGDHATPASSWWWFDVTGDNQRYAPFHPEPGDTKTTVRARIVGYYDALLARRAMPPQPRHGPGRRPGSPGAFGTARPATEAAPVPEEAARSSDTNGEGSDV